ncbi:MAG: hypothetical protein EON51_02195 [Acinetobacter sp.]|nr:MAG: hypothetical protein EON51_02195 [Acinetobacter sp.]
MTDKHIANDIINQVTLHELLEKLGFKPSLHLGNEIIYHGVFNAAEKEIRNTLSINNELGVWFDKGLARGGNILDFGITYWKNTAIDEVILQISKLCLSTANDEVHFKGTGRKRKAIKIPNYHIKEIKSIGLNPLICTYLHAEGLLDPSNKYLKEIYYYLIDEKGTRKDFFSAGWQNENGGWEVRSWYYSGCIGCRGISFIAGNVDSLILFENFEDYCKYLKETNSIHSSILILNSLDFLNTAIHRASKFSSIQPFFSCNELTARFLNEVKQLKNK